MQDLDMVVVGKNLRGKAKIPTVTLKSDTGDSLVFQTSKREFEAFEMDGIWTVTIVKEQQTLETEEVNP